MTKSTDPKQEPEVTAPTNTSQDTTQTHAEGTPRIIGIGASAGGLEALLVFLAYVPMDCGLAFVIIQHMSPTHKCVMPELLQRVTAMTVTQADNCMKVKPNCVYIIPPNKDLSILHGTLHLLEPAETRSLRLPIDSFFRALANDQHERAIGVILSGMGSDGTLGLRAIKENAGLALVQEPDSAKFDAMPRSAIDAGLADIVAPVEALPGKIIAYLQHPPHGVPDGVLGEVAPVLVLKSQSALEKIIILLHERSGNDFSQYKKNTLYRRIERRMGIHQIDTIANYVSYLRGNPQELDLLFKELLIGVTGFFRDPLAWEMLKTQALPALLATYPAGKPLRAWVPACSTGEEAYSLAIIFKEVLEQDKFRGLFTLQIFATDLDEDAIDKARAGLFRGNIAADASPERLARFFAADESGGYRIGKDIREMLVFAPQNIAMDPPFTRLDMLSCRNLLIYLAPELQNKLIPLFHYALGGQGILMLGSAETIGNFGPFFSVLDSKARLYQRVENPIMHADVNFPTRHFPLASLIHEEHKMLQPTVNLQALADQLLLRQFAPAAVLVTADGDILYINGRTGKYLEPAAGRANWNIYAMAREGLRYELAGALKKALRQAAPVTVDGLKVDSQTVNLTVQAIDQPEALRGNIMIVFNDVPIAPAGEAPRPAQGIDQQSLLAELEQARDEAQVLHEEMQTSQEELKSANEELTAFTEELQSLNEELQTVNAELQSKVEDLSWVNNDMKNLLNSTEIATVFLDNALHIRLFTAQTTHLFKLIPSDVGRPLSDIVTDLNYPQLSQDTSEVLHNLTFVEKQITTHDHRWFKARIMPYRTQNNVIDGVVITFIDITDFKVCETQSPPDLKEATQAHEGAVQ
jgi:chemotaxis protein methyltransferase CheR/two-component system CheB/CheR fusion protein